MDEIRKKILARQDKKLNEKFKKAKISILGCGGLGSNVAITLARAGVGELYLYDYDRVEYSNLNRQNYTIDDIGKSKAELTQAKIEAAIPNIKVYSKNLYITKENISSISDKTDIFIEAFDDEKSKAMLFDYFVGRQGKYLITASGLSGLGDIRDIEVKQIENVTLLGDFKSTPDKGLYMPYLGIIANLEALEALKIIKGVEDGK